MITTLKAIRRHGLDTDSWARLLSYLGKTQADDEPLRIIEILDSNGLSDALWCLRAVEGCEREIRLYAVWCARQAQHLMQDPRSVAAPDVAERHATGQATDEELAQAHEAAEAAKAEAWDAAWDAASAAEAVAAWDPAWAAAAAAADAAWATARAAADAAWETAAEAALVAAWEKARDAQARKLREVCAEWETTRGNDAPQT